MNRNLMLSIGMIAVAAAVLIVLLLVSGDSEPDATETPTGGEPPAELVRDDSAVLSEGADAVFVEFLDFECEACLAVYPFIEDLRERYGDRISFVVRHMPLHSNSVNAALAAEAAADQGEFEAMYHQLFDTAVDWGHQESSQRDTFFRYAEDLGLDMDAFAASFDDPATLDRIAQSQSDGQALGVRGTPTFFLDGEMLQVNTMADLEAALDAAIND